MTRAKRIRDPSASIRDRLLQQSRERGEPFELLLVRYAGDRLLYRLARSSHAEQFVLKGASLFEAWDGTPHRATRDVDFLKYGDRSVDSVRSLFRDLCSAAVDVDDGLRFAVQSLRVEEIREATEYGGVRVRLNGFMKTTRIPVQIDIGFGDVVTPAPEWVELPPLLDLPPTRLRAYPRVSVVAEKLHALVALGVANTRLKDLYDLWFMSQRFVFDGKDLLDAVTATFERRATPIPNRTPVALTPEFHDDAARQSQWKGFLDRVVTDASTTPALPAVAQSIRRFLEPVLNAAAGDPPKPFRKRWPAGGPWEASS